MNNLTRRVQVLGVVALIALSAIAALAQTPSQIELPNIDEPRLISTAYNRQGQGRILAANRDGSVHQYMEVWESKSKIPNVVTYILIGTDRQTFYSITWGRGPVNREAFNCKAKEIPEFGEKSVWLAADTDGVLTFREIQDDDIKSLFGNLLQIRRDWDLEVNSSNPKRIANTTQDNILTFVKKKNREKWVQLGWLQPATNCVRHF